jgi:integrase
MPSPNRRPGTLAKEVRTACRRRNLAYSTEKTYLGWMRRFVRYHGMRHPAELGEEHIREYLSHLATKRRVAASTQNQALNALVFLYGKVLGLDLDEFGAFVRARRPKRLPVVLTAAEAQRVLARIGGPVGLVARLLYGSGLRIAEAVTLRVKDVDFDYGLVHVQAAKGGKDRKTMLPERLHRPLKEHLVAVRRIHGRDLAAGYGQVPLPYAFGRKSPTAARDRLWQYIFPSSVRTTMITTHVLNREVHVRSPLDR